MYSAVSSRDSRVSRILAVTTAVLLVLAIAAFSVAIVIASVRWLALGALLATLTLVAFLWQVTVRYARLIAFWQADEDAVANARPRTDVGDLLVAPREPAREPTREPAEPPRTAKGPAEG